MTVVIIQIQSRGTNPFDIFGDVFLKVVSQPFEREQNLTFGQNVYVVFDQGNTHKLGS